MRSSSSSSKQETINNTNITKTITRTSIGDIGLTGDHAIALVRDVYGSAIQFAEVNAESFNQTLSHLTKQPNTQVLTIDRGTGSGGGGSTILQPTQATQPNYQNIMLAVGGLAAVATLISLRK